MNRRPFHALLCMSATLLAAWFGAANPREAGTPEQWTEVLPGVLRFGQSPAGYALVDGDAALLVDCPNNAEGLKLRGVSTIEGVLLTHHHRDICAAIGALLVKKVPVRAAKQAAEWLSPEKVNTYWRESIPLRNSRTAYLVLPEGLRGIDCTLEDGQTLNWRKWKIRVIATPGHSRDHLAFSAQRGDEAMLLFCGDAFASPRKLWTPYTTDWDHWTDAGLTPASQSLAKLAALNPAVLLPAHGPVIKTNAGEALRSTADAVKELAFLKSFERFTKQRLGNAPSYRFLAKEQVASSGEKPWTQVSEHLFLTGNTYVLTSKDRGFLVFDPWGKRSADQIARLMRDGNPGNLEVVMFSHAHFDHYDGIFELPARDQFQVWTLDHVAIPIADPSLLRAPFLDARPAKIDRRFKHGEVVTWHEYRFQFHHLPGQTEFTMGVETIIDGKRCFFTADNFFHQDQFSGTGGWMGLNRSYPLPYAASAQQVLDAAPEWVLAEHGGPFEFNAEDFRRRVEWGRISAHAADALCPSGNHRRDWDPNRIHVEPLLQTAQPGEVLQATIVATNDGTRTEKLCATLEGQGLIPDQRLNLEVPPGGSVHHAVTLQVQNRAAKGRHVFPLQVSDAAGDVGADAFFAIDIKP